MAEPFLIIASSDRDECPFPGLHSYDIDRQDYFKGREGEAIELAQQILANRLTVLTGGSGDGKTSLLHAGLAPLLLREGYDVVVTEPGGQAPVRAVALAMLERLLPVSDDDLALVQWLQDEVEGRSLRDKRAVLLAERQRGERRSPWPTNRPVDMFRAGPLWSWLISESCAEQIVDDALNAIARAISKPSGWPGLDAASIETLDFLVNAKEQIARRALTSRPQPMQMLDSALEELAWAIEHRADRAGFEIILVIDQLEEIFVQFRGIRQGPQGTEPWRHKQALLDLLFEIQGAPEWPVHLVLSLRKEHYADLQAVFPDQEALAANTYHLAPLRRDAGLHALDQLRPAPAPGRDDDAVKEWEEFKELAVNTLAAEREGKWVDATEISSFGTWLWNRPLPDDAREAVGAALLNQVREILDIRPDTAITTPVRRQEALDILNSLIIASDGGGGRRISLPEQALRVAEGRSPALRAEMLRYLGRSKLLRVEKKYGNLYYEVVHERLIAPVEALHQEWFDPRLNEFGRVLERVCERCLSNLFEPPYLSDNDLDVIAVNLERLDLTDFLASRLLDGLLAADRARDRRAVAVEARINLIQDFFARAQREAQAISPDTADDMARRSMAAGELASPALARALPFSDGGADAKARARWLIASSLLFAAPMRAQVRAWSHILRQGEAA